VVGHYEYFFCDSYYSLRSIFKRLSGSRCLLSVSIPANPGYNYYARHLSKYTPDLMHQETSEFSD